MKQYQKSNSKLNPKLIFLGSLLILISVAFIFASGCVTQENNNYILQEEYRLYGYDNPVIYLHFDKSTQKGYQIGISDGINLTILFDYELTSVGNYVGVPYGFYVNGEYSEALGNLQNITFAIQSDDTIRAKYKNERVTLHTPY